MHKSIFIILFGVIWVALGFSKQRDSLNQNNYNYSEESNLFKKIADVNILTSKGSQKLSSLYGTSPTIIAPIFTRCSGVCNPFLSNLKETVFHLSNAKEFKILVISFDPKDSLENMLKLAERYELNNNKQWVFATTNQITELNKSIGFSPVWDNTKKQFNHDALLVGINENGYIVKKLTGVREAQSLLTMIKEINNEFILSYPLPGKNTLFSCFTYNPLTGEKKPSYGLLVLLAPAIITLALLFWFASKKRVH